MFPYLLEQYPCSTTRQLGIQKGKGIFSLSLVANKLSFFQDAGWPRKAECLEVNYSRMEALGRAVSGKGTWTGTGAGKSSPKS